MKSWKAYAVGFFGAVALSATALGADGHGKITADELKVKDDVLVLFSKEVNAKKTQTLVCVLVVDEVKNGLMCMTPERAAEQAPKPSYERIEL